MDAESVDLIYLDPPFNSNANYNILYGTRRGGNSRAQARAFEDTWKWTAGSVDLIDHVAARHLAAGSLLEAFYKALGGSDMMAYLAMMTVRLIEMHRLLKSKGSLFLHCDPTASHYLKLVLDSIFGARNFRNEIAWKRTSAHSDAAQGLSRFGRAHDIILFYGKSDRTTWNVQFAPLTESYKESHYSSVDREGRRFTTSDLTAAKPGGDTSYDWKGVKPSAGRYWAYSKANMEKFEADGRLIYSKRGMPRLKNWLDKNQGVPLGDIWTDIFPVNSQARERIGYPTQKPQALLERIIATATNEGDTIFDPFCGCGTSIEAAQTLGRQWVGIDVTYLAIHVIEQRLTKAFGPEIKKEYSVLGQPKDADSANALAARDWLEFQKWSVIKLQGFPKDKPGADGGIDGVIRYHRVGIEQAKQAIVSVKGGLNIGVDAIHKLKSVVDREKAELGILVCVGRPTEPMRKEAASCGLVGPSSRRVPKIQIVSIEHLFDPTPIQVPGVIDPPEIAKPYIQPKPRSRRMQIEGQAELLFPITGEPPSPEKRQPKRSIREVDVEVTRAEPFRRSKR